MVCLPRQANELSANRLPLIHVRFRSKADAHFIQSSSNRSRILFSVFFRRRRRRQSVKHKIRLVLDYPLDNLTPLEFHGVGDGRREVYISLFAVFPFDKLNFCGVAHDKPPSMVVDFYI